MGTARNFTRRGKRGKFMLGITLYFKSPSINGLRMYHYKRYGKSSSTIQITKQKYDKANNRKNKSYSK